MGGGPTTGDPAAPPAVPAAVATPGGQGHAGHAGGHYVNAEEREAQRVAEEKAQKDRLLQVLWGEGAGGTGQRVT